MDPAGRDADDPRHRHAVRSIGRTSMKIAIEAWRRPREHEEVMPVTRAIFTFVAIDADGRPRPVPEAP
jgi:acyl-CoA thioesterase YciA